MYRKELDVAKRAAMEAGTLLKKLYNDTHKITMKTSRDVVTEADVASEKIIIEMLKKEFPSYNIVSEEAGTTKNESELTWVIDPLDGTTNYSIKNPFFNVAIALVKQNEPVVGVVYFPTNNELFWAATNEGAFMNRKKISVSATTDIRSSMGGFCYGTTQKAALEMAKIYSTVMPAVRGFTQMRAGELELAFVAAGRLDFFLNHDQKAWDVAAGAVIAKEAGATVTDFSGDRWDLTKNGIVVSNGHMHENIIKLLKR